MTALLIAFGVALVAIAILGCAWAGWATADEADRLDLQGRITLRYLALVLTVLVAGAEGWVDRRSLFLGIAAALLGRWWAERPLHTTRPPLPRRPVR